MKEFIDKLIERLEEEPVLSINMGKDYLISGNAIPKERVLEIVIELAEEYKVSEMQTGWIPCSERLPEEAACYLVAWMDERNRPIPFYEIVEFDSVDWCEGYIPQAEGNYRILAWQPLPAPYMKGE